MAHGDELAQTAADSAAAATPRVPGPGDTIGRYRVDRVLGQGGMGVVYAAHDPDLDRSVALKVLRGAAGDEARTRLLREARAMAKLSHPNVITVYEVGSAGPIDFVAMELIDGKSLAEWLKEHRRSQAEILRVFRAAARGLNAAHAAGLVHRDFKPANVLIGRHERIVVTDFGLARAYDDLEHAETPVAVAALEPPASPRRFDAASLSSTLTRTGALLGTPAYMAPEQFAGVTAGPRSDQYAFCVALWEALAGGRPFRGGSLEELQRAVASGTTAGVDEVPRWLRPILLRGLAREAVDRFPDLAALMAAIDRGERRPRTLALAATAGAALAAAALVIAVVPRGARAPSTPPPPPCVAADVELAGAWSPQRAGALAVHLTTAPGTARELGDGIERLVGRWRTTYAATCATAAGPERDGALSCLARVRDQLAAVTTLAESSPPASVLPAGLLDEVDDPAGCEHPGARARPALPTDPSTRAALSALRTDAARALMLVPTEDEQPQASPARALADDVVARARGLGHPAALAEALLAAGTIARRADDYARAEAMFDEAATTAEAIAANGLRAAAMVGTAACTAARSSNTAAIRAALTKARAATTRAGDPPELVAELERTTALLELRGGDVDRALLALERARRGFDRAGMSRSEIASLGLEAHLLSQRARTDDQARATLLLTDAIERSRRVYGPTAPMTNGLRTALAWLMASTDAEAAGRLLASVPRPHGQPAGVTVVRGQVVDPDGRPRAGAVVYTGDVLIALADGTVVPSPFDRQGDGGRSTATATDGTFALAVRPSENVIAVAGDLRSLPVRASEVPARLVLRPTRAARVRRPTSVRDQGAVMIAITMADGKVDLGYQAIAQQLDGETWEARALPGARDLQVIAARSSARVVDYVTLRAKPRTGASLDLELPTPPPGVTLDLVVRGDRLIDLAGASTFILTGHALAGRTLKAAELGHLAFDGERVFSAYAQPLDPGAAPTAGGPARQPGDLGVTVPEVPVGPITVCVLPLGLDVRDPRLLEAVPDLEQLDTYCHGVVVPDQASPFSVVIVAPAMQRPR